ncbi:hypothetical protein C1N69_14525 [Enterobacter sichuanensis]|nr:hypothetical protein C1N69_14525 [Enterobacter sichuanensis]
MSWFLLSYWSLFLLPSLFWCRRASCRGLSARRGSACARRWMPWHSSCVNSLTGSKHSSVR